MRSLDVKVARAYENSASAKGKTARHHWWPVAYSSALDEQPDKPVGFTLFGEPLVLFRAQDGSVQCVADVCPHKSSALSLGCVRDGELVCRYHGWRFGKDGQCQSPPELAGKSRTALYAYPAIDDGLLVWVCPSFEAPPAFVNPLLALSGQAGVTVNLHKKREFNFHQPWELWAASFVDGTHHQHAHPITFLQTQRNSLDYLFDETLTPAAMAVYGKHDPRLGVFAYLVFSPVDEHHHRQFLTLFPFSEVLPQVASYALFRALRIPDTLYKVVYEDYYLIVKQVERIRQGASKWGIRGKYGYPASDRYIDWHRAHEDDAVWFKAYGAEGRPQLRTAAAPPPGASHPAPMVEDSGLQLGPYGAARRHGRAPLAEPATWHRLNLYDRVIKAIVERFGPPPLPESDTP